MSTDFPQISVTSVSPIIQCSCTKTGLSSICVICVHQYISEKATFDHLDIQRVRDTFLDELHCQQRSLTAQVIKVEDLQEFIKTVIETLRFSESLSRTNAIIDVLEEAKANQDSSPSNNDASRDSQNVSLDSDIVVTTEKEERESFPITIAAALLKDLNSIVNIFNITCKKEFDRIFLSQVKGMRLLSSLENSTLPQNGLIKIEDSRLNRNRRSLMETLRVDGSLIEDIKRASISRRQSLDIFENDKKILLLINENERLDFSLTAKEDELNMLRYQLQKLEEDLLRKNEVVKFEESPQVKLLSAELDRINKALEFKNKEIQELCRKNSDNIAESGDALIELQAQIDLLIQENERLNSVISAKEDEIAVLSCITSSDESADSLKAELLKGLHLQLEKTATIALLQKEITRLSEVSVQEREIYRSQANRAVVELEAVRNENLNLKNLERPAIGNNHNSPVSLLHISAGQQFSATASASQSERRFHLGSSSASSSLTKSVNQGYFKSHASADRISAIPKTEVQSFIKESASAHINNFIGSISSSFERTKQLIAPAKFSSSDKYEGQLLQQQQQVQLLSGNSLVNSARRNDNILSNSFNNHLSQPHFGQQSKKCMNDGVEYQSILNVYGIIHQSVGAREEGQAMSVVSLKNSFGVNTFLKAKTVSNFSFEPAQFGIQATSSSERRSSPTKQNDPILAPLHSRSIHQDSSGNPNSNTPNLNMLLRTIPLSPFVYSGVKQTLSTKPLTQSFNKEKEIKFDNNNFLMASDIRLNSCSEGVRPLLAGKGFIKSSNILREGLRLTQHNRK